MRMINIVFIRNDAVHKILASKQNSWREEKSQGQKGV